MGSFKDTLQLPKTQMPISADLPAHEPAVYQLWNESGVYARMKRDGKNPFVLHDGPPYANGDIHIGHALNKILKDFVVKFQYFEGRAVEFVPGWDCHGLPIEQKVQAMWRLGGPMMKSDNGRGLTPMSMKEAGADLTAMCRKYAGEQIAKQKEQFKTLGVLADWDNHYETMSPAFEKMIADRLEELHRHGYLMRRLKPVYWSWAYQTALAEAEVEYQERTDNSIYLVFKTDRFPWGFLVWTTTPWTLPANVAVALNPDMEYRAVHVKDYDLPVLVAADLVESLKAKGIVLDVVQNYKAEGGEFRGWKLQHPIYPDQEVPIIMADFVTADSGTGCVHIAPGHGEDDYHAALANDLPMVMPVGPDGRYTEGKYAGQWIFEDDSNESLAAKKAGDYKKCSYNSNANIFKDLAEQGLLVHTEQITHSYPYCSRSNTPVIFRATEQWFLDLEKIRNLILGPFLALENVEFYPDNAKNRMLPMIQNRPDWCISRQRAWGVPIMGGPDILDVWFDSGLTWNILKDGQADVYLEGNDQHRGWFQSSLWLSVALQGVAPYKKVITHGFVVDQDGKKMAKSKGNVVSPLEVTTKQGAEVLRYWVASTDYTKDVQCSPEIIKRASEGHKKLRNTFRFLVANMPADPPYKAYPEQDEKLLPVDRWIYDRSREVFAEVHRLFSHSLFFSGIHKLTDYINNDLSGIYMNAAKDRLYCDGFNSFSRNSAIFTMSKILKSMMTLVAPVLTYTAQEVFGYCPKWLVGEAKDIFDLRYEPLPKLDGSALDEDFWKEALSAFHVEFDRLKTEGKVRDTLEVVLEGLDFFDGAEDWFVVSGCSKEPSELDPLAEFKVGDHRGRIVKSPRNKCERCWKRNADNNLCLRCRSVVGPSV